MDGTKSIQTTNARLVLQILQHNQQLCSVNSQNKGVQRVAVGIGKDVKQSELETIAGNKDRVINAENFGDLNEKLKDISEAVCSKLLSFSLVLEFNMT